MQCSIIILVLLLAVFYSLGEAKTFGKCEFVNTLRSYGFPNNEIPTWVCIANYESHFDTNALNTATGDHGIFQISQIYWCSISGSPGGGCNARCSDFHDDDIRNDAACVRIIFNEHQHISGNGFSAWVTYKQYCQGDNSNWIVGC